jgi:multiple sugar transport system ATP-binding protein
MSAIIEVRDVTMRFGEVMALDRVNLSVDAGEFLVLLGPSGCGKTTLLRCLAGLETPDEGEILIGGDIVFSARRGISVPPGDRQVGMVFQSYALWPHMKVYDNVGFGLGVQKLSKQETRERVSKVLHDLAMDGMEDRYPSELSGGQQQRIALARLLATRPPVFLMDEPLSNLDARLRVDMRSELKRLHRHSGASTVYVTHDQTEAMTMATLVVVMNEGRIHQAAPPSQVYHEPADVFVADFIGMPRTNLLSASTVRRNGQQVALEIGDFSFSVPWVPDRAKVMVAAKPEDISLSLEAAAEAIEFQVYAVQPAGPELIVQVQRGATRLVIRETGELKLEMDQPVWVTFDPLAINLFDEESGKLLRPPGEGQEGGSMRALRS